jgi:hypothetical protein
MTLSESRSPVSIARARRRRQNCSAISLTRISSVSLTGWCSARSFALSVSRAPGSSVGEGELLGRQTVLREIEPHTLRPSHAGRAAGL